jgi:hypothetical protein
MLKCNIVLIFLRKFCSANLKLLYQQILHSLCLCVDYEGVGGDGRLEGGGAFGVT